MCLETSWDERKCRILSPYFRRGHALAGYHNTDVVMGCCCCCCCCLFSCSRKQRHYLLASLRIYSLWYRCSKLFVSLKNSAICGFQQIYYLRSIKSVTILRSPNKFSSDTHSPSYMVPTFSVRGTVLRTLPTSSTSTLIFISPSLRKQLLFFP